MEPEHVEKPEHVDIDEAGDPFWVECVGGPFDGEMMQLRRDRMRWPDGTVSVGRGFFVPGNKKTGGQGHYVEQGWHNRDLKVVRYIWHHDPEDEIAEPDDLVNVSKEDLRKAGVEFLDDESRDDQ